MNKKTKTIFKMQIITIGLILGGIGFFNFAKAVELPAGFTPPTNPNQQKSTESQNAPADSQGPIDFKQINLLLSDLKLDKAEYSSGDTVKGSFKLKNISNMYSSGFYYQVALHKPDTSKENVVFFNQLTAIDYTQSELINVAPQEEKTFPFSYKIPKFCSSDSGYSIQVTVFNARGYELANGFQKLTVKNATGDERFAFLDLTQSQVFTATKPYRVQDGGVFEYDKEYNPAMEKDKPSKDIILKNEVQTKIAYSIKNNLKEKAVAKVSFSKHGSYLDKLESKTYEIPNLNGSESFDLKLPLFSDPGAYQAVVQLFIGEEKVSNPLIIRYTTQGDSGLIYDFLVEKNGGNNFTLNLLWAGPADSNVRVDANGFGAQILFEAKEEKTQKICFEKTISIDPKQGALTQVPFVMGDCSSPYQFTAKLQKDGKILDEQQFSEPKKEEAKKESGSKYSTRNIILFGFGILTIILILIIFLKKRSNRFVPIIILVFVASLGLFFLSSQETKAAHHGTFDFSTSSGGAYRFVYYHPIWSSSYTQPSCPSGYVFPSVSTEWGSQEYTGLCCPAGFGVRCGEWGECICSGGWEGSESVAGVQPIPGYWTPYIAGYYNAYDYYLTNGKTTFNQGENLYFYEAIHAYPNCGNGGGPGPGASYYYLYSQATGALVYQGAYSFNEYSGGAGINIPLNFAPGGYTFVIYGWKTFYGGQDDPMYNGSISIVGSINIVNPNPTLTVSKSGYGTVSGTGINCGSTCSASYALNTPISLTALASDPNSTFAGWTGNCSGTGACNLVMDSAKSVSASFSCNCSATENASHCQGTTYTNSCGNTCSGTQIESDGVCGSATTQSWSNEPATNLCSYGTDSGMTKVGNNWKWTCSGTCGGKNVSCTARRDNNWKEVMP